MPRSTFYGGLRHPDPPVLVGLRPSPCRGQNSRTDLEGQNSRTDLEGHIYIYIERYIYIYIYTLGATALRNTAIRNPDSGKQKTKKTKIGCSFIVKK